MKVICVSVKPECAGCYHSVPHERDRGLCAKDRCARTKKVVRCKPMKKEEAG